MDGQSGREQVELKAKQECDREVGGDAESIHRIAGNRQQRGEQHGEWIGHEAFRVRPRPLVCLRRPILSETVAMTSRSPVREILICDFPGPLVDSAGPVASDRFCRRAKRLVPDC